MKTIITSKEEFESLNEAFKSEYEESNGIYILKADGIDDHPAVKGLKGAYTATKEKQDFAKKRLDELEAEKKRLDEEKLFEQQKYKELAEIKDKESKEYADKLKALQDSVTQKEMEKKASAIASMINPHDAVRQELAAEKALNFIKKTDDGIIFINEDGSPSDEKTVITKITTKYSFLAAGNGSSGGGANGSTNYTPHTAPPKTATEAIKNAFQGV